MVPPLLWIFILFLEIHSMVPLSYGYPSFFIDANAMVPSVLEGTLLSMDTINPNVSNNRNPHIYGYPFCFYRCPTMVPSFFYLMYYRYHSFKNTLQSFNLLYDQPFLSSGNLSGM